MIKNSWIALFFIISPMLLLGVQKDNLKFNLKFGFIKGGQAQMIISDTIYNDIPAIHYYLVGKTTGLTNTLFKVHDIYETIVDAKTGLPLKSIRNIREKKYRSYNEVNYYHEKDSLHSQKAGWMQTPDSLVDIISVFFYFINHNYIEKIDQGETISFPTYHADKINDISIRFLGFETLKTKIGDIDCYVLAPFVEKGKVLKRADGLKFYISKTDKVPILLEFDMKVGALRAVLESYETE